jgi:hypothetical protein
MDGYRHLSIAEREDIMVRWKDHEGVSQIAREPGRDKSTVSREIRRNGWRGPSGRVYRASTSQGHADERRLRCRRPRLMDDPERRALVVGLMRDEHWSPEQISGRIAMERPDLAVSRESIYRAARSGALARELPGHRKASVPLGRHGKRRRGKGFRGRRGKVRITHDISERPEEASSRRRIGDWEGDTVAGRRGARLVTQVDRMSGFLVGGKAARRPMPRSTRRPRGRSPASPCARSRSTGARSSPTRRGCRKRWGLPPASAVPTILGSAGPTRTPTVSSGTGSRRARASTTSPTRKFKGRAIRSTGDRASVWGGNAPGRSTIASRCACSENSPAFGILRRRLFEVLLPETVPIALSSTQDSASGERRASTYRPLKIVTNFLRLPRQATAENVTDFVAWPGEWCFRERSEADSRFRRCSEPVRRPR